MIKGLEDQMKTVTSTETVSDGKKLSDTQRMIIEQRITNEKPSIGVAYLLLLFLGWVGAHRFYLGRKGSAVAMLILTCTFIGFVVTAIWTIVDLFLIPSMVKEDTNAIRQRVTVEEMSR